MRPKEAAGLLLVICAGLLLIALALGAQVTSKRRVKKVSKQIARTAGPHISGA